MGRTNFLIEGVSGSGKSAVCDELRRRGYDAVNGDRELAYQGDPETGVAVDGLTGPALHAHHLWHVDQVEARVADRAEPVTYFCGGSRNHGEFVDLFDDVFVLTVDPATLARRLDLRPGDEWAGNGRAEERALTEHLHATGSGIPVGTAIDATRPLARVVDEILRRSGRSGATRG